MIQIAQRVTASDDGQSQRCCNEIPDEEFSPRRVSYADVREHGGQHHERRLEEDCAEDDREHHSRLLHRSMDCPDDRQTVSDTQREMDDGKACEAAEEVKRAERLTLEEIDAGEPQPGSRANYQTEADAFPRGVVCLRCATNRGIALGNYMYACHDIMINGLRPRVSMARSYQRIGDLYQPGSVLRLSFS